MWKTGRRAAGVALLAVVALTGTACSSTGGKQTTQQQNGNGTTNVAATPKYKVAMITHASAGDTFFDIIRKGATAAAQKDNIQYTYSSSDQPDQQATLIQNAVDSKVDAIAVTMPNTAALATALKNAKAAGIPVVGFNAGVSDWKSAGMLEYFGQDESLAGQAAGKRLAGEGAKKVLCVIQTQGQVQLEARCAGVAQGLGSAGTSEKLYVNGTDMTQVQSTIQAKLAQDPSIDHIITLGAPVALTAVKSIQTANSKAKLDTFDTNAALVAAVKSGSVEWAVDQQPYLQGYEAIDSLWLYLTNRNVIGGGQAVLTGPAFVDSSNIDAVSKYAQAGTR